MSRTPGLTPSVSAALDRLVGTRVLVLGAGGFVGRHVVAALRARGAQVHATAHAAGARPLPIEVADAAITTHSVDLALPGAAADLIARVAPTAVINLVAYGVHAEQRDDTLAHRLNGKLPAEIAHALSDLAARRQLAPWAGARLVHAGSMAEYGRAGGDLSESTAPQPASVYGRTKLAGTLALLEQAQALALPVVVARLFMLYGAGERLPRLLPSLVDAAKRRSAIELTEGVQRRDFVWVGDAALALLLLAGADAGDSSSIVNVATGRLTSVRDFVQLAARELGMADAQLRFGALPMRDDDPFHDAVSVARLRERTGWLPPTDPATGLHASLEGGA